MSVPIPDDDPPILRHPAFGATDQASCAVTVGRVIGTYLVHLRARFDAGDLSDTHLRDTSRDLKLLAGQYGQRPATEFRTSDLAAFVLGRPSWKAAATKRRVLAEILACFSWAADEAGLLDHNHVRRPKRLRLPVRPRREARVDEYVAVMRKASRELRRALFVLRRNSVRTCELRMASWPDVLWEDGLLVADRNKTVATTGETRFVGLETCTLRLLRNMHARAADKQGPIFLNGRGRRWTAAAFCQALRRTLQKAGIDPGRGKRLTAYMFRHAWTGNACEAGCSDRMAADGLGHTSTALVSYYSKARQRAGYLRNIANQAVKRQRRHKG